MAANDTWALFVLLARLVAVVGGLGLVLVFLLARRRIIAALVRRASVLAGEEGAYRRALTRTRWARRLSLGEPTLAIVLVESPIRREIGEEREALDALMSWQTLENASPYLANCTVDLLVSMGRYREALRVSSPALDQLKAHALPLLAGMPVLVQINRAEAEYNLGLWAEAEARLDRPDARHDASPICHAGSRLQRAWVLAHRGRADEALALCDEMRVEDLPGAYRAEAWYSRAAALLGQSKLEEAEAATQRGIALAKRGSTGRNGLFLLARVAARRQDWARAEGLCRQAAAHRWRYQGGEGLLLWGDALSQLGRSEEAAVAWALVTERDPESESAALAQTRLRAAA